MIESLPILLSPASSDGTAPTRTGINASGQYIDIGYDEALDSASTPATGAYTHSTKTITAVSVSGSRVRLTVSVPFTVGAAGGTLSYTAGGAPVQDAAGNDAANFSTQSVTNLTSNLSGTPRLRAGFGMGF